MQRYTFFFTNYTQGWSETLFRAAPFGETEQVYLTQYINRRLELLATSCVLVSVRSSNTDSKRDVLVYPLPNAGRGGVWATQQGDGVEAGLGTDTEDSFTALLLRLSDNAAHYRSFPLLGLPDHVIQGSVIVPQQQANLNSRLNNWMSAITQAGFGMKAQAAPTVVGRIAHFFPTDETLPLVCLGLRGPIPAAGSLVTLGSVKPFNKLNRTWRVAATAPGDANADGYIYLAGTTALKVYGQVQGGSYKVPNYSLAVLTNYTVSRITSRRTGVPFTTVRGRR